MPARKKIIEHPVVIDGQTAAVVASSGKGAIEAAIEAAIEDDEADPGQPAAKTDGRGNYTIKKFPADLRVAAVAHAKMRGQNSYRWAEDAIREKLAREAGTALVPVKAPGPLIEHAPPALPAPAEAPPPVQAEAVVAFATAIREAKAAGLDVPAATTGHFLHLLSAQLRTARGLKPRRTKPKTAAPVEA